MTDLTKILEIAKKAAQESAGKAVKTRNSGDISVEFKSPRELVTRADKESEVSIMKCIQDAFPSHTFLSEESQSSHYGKNLAAPLWIIDPIDGTTNFAHGLQHWAVSIAFAEKGIVQVGVVYAPVLNEMFYSIKEHGAFLNDTKIRVSERIHFREALVATGFPYERDSTRLNSVLENSRKILENCRDIRRLGAASLDICYVACGRMDMFYEDLSPWDMAAAGLIAREAGALTGNWMESNYNASLPSDLKSQAYLVGNKSIYGQALDVLIKTK